MGPPPEFPLASPCSGIVHHLSRPCESALAPPLGHRACGPAAGRTSWQDKQWHPGLVQLTLGPCFKTGWMVAGSPAMLPPRLLVRQCDSTLRQCVAPGETWGHPCAFKVSIITVSCNSH